MRKLVTPSRLQVYAGLFAVVIFTGAQCGTPANQQQSIVGTSPGTVAASEVTNLYTLLNQERASRGVPALTLNTTIQTVSQLYSNDLVAANLGSYNFAINGLDGPTRLRNASISFSRSIHIGAMDFTTAQTLLDALKSSNSNLLTDSGMTRIGIAQAKSASHNFWTILAVDQ